MKRVSYSLFLASSLVAVFFSSGGKDALGALGLLIFSSAAIVALAIFKGFLETERIFADTSFIPAKSMTYRATLPAITPFPGLGE